MELSPLIAVSAVVSCFGPAILLLAFAPTLDRGALLRGYAELSMSIALPSISVGVMSELILSTWFPGGRAGALFSALTGFAILFSSYLRFRPLSLVRASLARIGVPGKEHDSMERLLTSLERMRPAQPADRPYRGRYPDVVLGASVQLIAQGYFLPAEQLCADLPEAWLSDAQSAQRANNLAVCRMRFGDASGARAALECSETGADEDRLHSAAAMLLLLQGKFRDALALVGEPVLPSLVTPMTALVVRAHAHAGLGEVDEARQIVEEILEKQGPEALDALVHPAGPATSLALAAKGEQPLSD